MERCASRRVGSFTAVPAEQALQAETSPISNYMLTTTVAPRPRLGILDNFQATTLRMGYQRQFAERPTGNL
jgi:hypothetical protein